MIQPRTLLTVVDNTGAKFAMCFTVYGGSRKRYAHVGDRIKVAIKDASPTASVKKKSIAIAVVVRTKKPVKRADGTYVRSDDNACVIIDDKGEPKGTRIFGPVFRELREAGYQKIISLAQEVI